MGVHSRELEGKEAHSVNPLIKYLVLVNMGEEKEALSRKKEVGGVLEKLLEALN